MTVKRVVSKVTNITFTNVYCKPKANACTVFFHEYCWDFQLFKQGIAEVYK